MIVLNAFTALKDTKGYKSIRGKDHFVFGKSRFECPRIAMSYEFGKIKRAIFNGEDFISFQKCPVDVEMVMVIV